MAVLRVVPNVAVDDVPAARDFAAGPADERWRVRRFHVRDPLGKPLDILTHSG